MEPAAPIRTMSIMLFSSLIAALGVTILLSPNAYTATTTVSVSGTASHAIPTTLFGQMFEDINSGDGGLYAELLQNRAFQQVTPNTASALTAWSAVNGAQLTVVADPKPVSAALPNSLEVKIPAGKTGQVGFSNSGFWGIKVNSSWVYDASLYFKFPTASSFSGTLTLALQTSQGSVLAKGTTTIHGSQTQWAQVQLKLQPTTTPSDTNNVFTVTVDGAAAAGQTVHFAMLSLFPPTFKNRPNGMRIDIAETLAEMGPTFFRFPGGNNIGQTVASRWQWNATVGSLLDRPGRAGDWGYANTDGLGLLEFLTFFEDVGMEPIMAVYSDKQLVAQREAQTLPSAGYSLGGTNLLETQLQPYIEQAVEQINFVIGDAALSAPAALRSSLGHPEPFALRYVEIGNEDFFASATYPYRFRDFVGNLSAVFPQLTFIATSYAFDPVLTPNPQAYDVHVYNTPGWFADNAFYYDGFQRNSTKYFEGEYAVISTNASDIFGTPDTGRLLFPIMQGSAGEAAFMTGLERNSDIVFAASYAPLLQHLNSTQWTPDLISFDAGNVYRSTSFYVQKLFSLNKGDEYLPSTLPKQGGSVFWSVTRENASQTVIIKVSNVGSAAAALSFQLPFQQVSPTGTLERLSGAPTASNTPQQPNLVVPVTSTITTGKTIDYNAPGFSVSVIRVQAS